MLLMRFLLEYWGFSGIIMLIGIRKWCRKGYFDSEIETMCKIIERKIGNRTIKVADIKFKYMENIVSAARECDYIDRIVLFGSSTKTRCKKDSDIDLAVFGNVNKSRCLTSKKYETFLRKVYSFDDFNQSYDILYFRTGQRNNSAIMNDIDQGELLYEANL